MEHLSKDELKNLLTVAKSKSERDYLILLVGFSHALRVSEILGLEAKDIKDGFMTVQRLKGSMRTVQSLVSSADPLFDEKTAITEWLRKIPSGKLFNISRKRVWQLMKEYGKAAGIENHRLFPHVLKHSAAMLSIKKAGIENVRQYLGHRSISSTGAYLRVSDSEASKAVMAAFEG